MFVSLLACLFIIFCKKKVCPFCVLDVCDPTIYVMALQTHGGATYPWWPYKPMVALHINGGPTHT